MVATSQSFIIPYTQGGITDPQYLITIPVTGEEGPGRFKLIISGYNAQATEGNFTAYFKDSKWGNPTLTTFRNNYTYNNIAIPSMLRVMNANSTKVDVSTLPDEARELTITLSISNTSGYAFKSNSELNVLCGNTKIFLNDNASARNFNTEYSEFMSIANSGLSFTRVDNYTVQWKVEKSSYNTFITLMNQYSGTNRLLALVIIDTNGGLHTFDDLLTQDISIQYNLTNNDNNINVSNLGPFDSGETAEITISCKPGYFYPDTLPYATNDETTVNFVKTGDNEYKATITFDSNYEIISEAKEYITLSFTCNNCTCNYENGTRFEKGSSLPHSIVIIANTDYTFNSRQVVHVGPNEYMFVIYTEQIQQIQLNNVNDNITFEATAIYNPIRHLNNTDEGITVSPNRTFTDGESVEITISCKSGYFYPSILPTATNGINTIPFVETGDNEYKATITFDSDYDIISDSKQYVTLTYTCNNCTCNYASGTRFVKGSATPNDITITPISHFKFNGAQRFEYGRQTKTFNIIPNQDYQVISASGTPYLNENISFNAEAVYHYDKLGFISIYNPTSSEMEQLAKKRFFNPVQGEFIDYSDYIISLKKLYINLPSAGRQSVYYGSYNTQIQSNVVPSDNIEIDCGTVRITEQYNNRMDYDNTTIEIYLPFIGQFTVDTYKCMGKQMRLKYYVNPISGDCVAKLTREGSTTFFESYEGNVSFEIPIVGTRRDGGIDRRNYNDNSLYLLNEITPYLLVTRDNPMIANDRTEKPDYSVGLVSNYSGICTFDNIELNMGDMTQDEYNEIISILKTGVIL